MLGRLADAAQAAAQATAESQVSAWDTAASFASQMVKNATQGYSLYHQIATGTTPPPAPTLAQSTTTTSNILLYGGLAVAAVALVLYMKKHRK
jgi:hypothetical protein